MARAFDIFLVVILVAFMLNGLRRKAFAEMVGFAAWVPAVAVALRVQLAIGPAFSRAVVLRPEMTIALIFTLVFVIILFIYKFLENWLVQHISLKIPPWMDRSTGVVVGFFKGSFIAGLLAVFLSMIPAGPAFQRDVASSRLIPVAEGVFTALYDTAVRPVPVVPDLVGTLESTAEAFGIENINNRYLYTLRDLGSLKVERWLETAKK